MDDTRSGLHRLRSQLWQAPRRHGELQRERTVGPLELFYDLVVVVMVAQAAHTFTKHMTLHGFGQFAAVFGVVWLAWFNGTSLHDLHGREDIRSRNIFVAQILLLVPLGAFIEGAGGKHGQAFATTAAVLFLCLAFFWWSVSWSDEEQYLPATRIYVGITLGLAVGLGISAPMSDDGRLVLWGVLTVLYLVGIVVAFGRVPGRFQDTFTITDALNERFGLLVIIVLGETVTGVVSGLTPDPANGHKLAVSLVCVLVGFGAWWTYFDFVGHKAPRPDRGSTLVWLYAHLPITASIAAMGATMPTFVEHASGGHRAPVAATWVMCAGAAVVLVFTVVLMLSLTDWRVDAAKLRPLAVACLLGAAAMIVVGIARPSPLVLCILLVACFSGPWLLGVLRRASIDLE